MYIPVRLISPKYVPGEDHSVAELQRWLHSSKTQSVLHDLDVTYPFLTQVNANCATLSNYEVLKHLQKLKEGRTKHNGQLATITYETIRYLENTPCKEQSPETITKCLQDLAPYNLNKTELLMIINSPPTTDLEIQLMIEESEDRLTEEQVKKIVEIVGQHFPHVIKEHNVEEKEDTSE